MNEKAKFPYKRLLVHDVPDLVRKVREEGLSAPLFYANSKLYLEYE